MLVKKGSIQVIFGLLYPPEGVQPARSASDNESYDLNCYFLSEEGEAIPSSLLREEID
jgi:hypothetical protein